MTDSEAGGSYQPIDQGRCAACGGFLESRDRGGCRVIEFKAEHRDVMLRDLAKIDTELAGEIRDLGGIIPLHIECEHPVEQYLYTGSQQEDGR